MDFERQFVKSTSGQAPSHCYEAATLHRKNLHVRIELQKLISRRECACAVDSD